MSGGIQETLRPYQETVNAQAERIRTLESDLAVALAVIERLRANQDDGRDRIVFLEARLTAVTQWLEANEPSVFQRGLWDAVFAATPEVR